MHVSLNFIMSLATVQYFTVLYYSDVHYIKAWNLKNLRAKEKFQKYYQDNNMFYENMENIKS